MSAPLNRRSAARRGAGRRVRARTALLLCLYCAVGMLFIAILSGFAGAAFAPWLSMLGTLLFLAAPAYLGLFVLDGDQSALLDMKKLSGAQAMWTASSGALLVCPSLLMSGVMTAIAHTFGAAPAQVQPALDGSLLLPMLLASGVLAPVCEELFFRGYVQGVFSDGVGRARGALLAALAFAVVHGMGGEAAVLVLLGLLFSAAGWKMQSILAPVLLHSAYNITLILLSAVGMGGMLSQLTMLSGLILLAGTAGFVYTLGRAWRAEEAKACDTLPEKKSRRRTKKNEPNKLLAVLAFLLLIVLAQLAPAAFEGFFAWLAELAREKEAAEAAAATARLVWEVLA